MSCQFIFDVAIGAHGQFIENLVSDCLNRITPACQVFEFGYLVVLLKGLLDALGGPHLGLHVDIEGGYIVVRAFYLLDELFTSDVLVYGDEVGLLAISTYSVVCLYCLIKFTRFYATDGQWISYFFILNPVVCLYRMFYNLPVCN